MFGPMSNGVCLTRRGVRTRHAMEHTENFTN